MKKHLIISLLLFSNLFVIYGQDQTQDTIAFKKHPILENKIFFNAGVFFPQKQVNLKVTGDAPGDAVDFNKAFGAKQSEVTFAGNFIWSFSKKWRLGLEYFSIKNTKSWNIDKDINWEDLTFRAGAFLNAGLQMNIYRLSIGKIISSGNKYEFGGGFGIHAINIITSVEGGAYIDNKDFSFENRSFNITAPLPNLNVWFFYAPTRKIALTARIDWMDLSIGEIGGGIWNIAPGVKYQIFKNFGASVNYRYLHINMDLEKKFWTAKIDMVYQGPLLTLTGNF